MVGYDTAWTSKVVGDSQAFNQIPPKEGTVSYGVNVLRSLRWPGAVTVAKGGKFTSIYVGYGLKRGGVNYTPTEPPAVINDPTEAEEMPEPYPLHEPIVKAPEEGEEGKEDDGEEAD